MPRKSAPNSAGNRAKTSLPVSKKPCAGTSPIAIGGGTSDHIAATGLGSLLEARHERHHPRRRRGHAASSAHACDEQAIAARLRQADDLLPAVHADAGG